MSRPLGSLGPAPCAQNQSAAGTQAQKKSILIGKRPGLGVSSMINQFKNYSQSKKSTLLAARPSVFSSPDDEDEEEDDAHFLEVKGIRFHLSLVLTGELVVDYFYAGVKSWFVLTRRTN